jgi:hypothetical protein
MTFLCALNNDAFNDRGVAKAASSEIDIMMHKPKLRRRGSFNIIHLLS